MLLTGEGGERNCCAPWYNIAKKMQENAVQGIKASEKFQLELTSKA
jgi:hypothetical protein